MEDEGNEADAERGRQMAMYHYNYQAVPMVINLQNNQVGRELESFCTENGLQYSFSNWSGPSSAVVSPGGGSNYPCMSITNRSESKKVNIVFPRDQYSLFLIFSGDGRTRVKEFEYPVSGRTATLTLIANCEHVIRKVFNLGEVQAVWEDATGMS